MNLSTENILIRITNPYIVKPNIPFLLVKKNQQIQQSYVLESYQHVLEIPFMLPLVSVVYSLLCRVAFYLINVPKFVYPFIC